MRLWFKIFLLNILVVLSLGIMMGLAIRGVVIDSMRDEFLRQGTSIVKNFADRIAVSIIVGDRYDIEKAAQEVTRIEKDIAYIYLTGFDGRLLFHTFPDGHPPDILEWNPVRISDAPTTRLLDAEEGLIRDIGLQVVEGMSAELHIGLSEKRLASTLTTIRTLMIIIMAVAVIIGCVLSLALSKRITRPLEILVGFTQDLSRGEFGQQVKVHARDEAGYLAETFNELSNKLKIYRDNKEEHYRQMLQAEKLTALGRLSAGLAHEIRNPLTSIKSLFQSFEKNPDVSGKDIKIVLTAVDQMDELVTKFLGFARSESFHLSTVYPNVLLKQIATLTQFQIRTHNIELEFELEKLLQFQGDGSMIRQALLNLIMNAIEAMPDGGRLYLATKMINDQIEISITDTGCGIPGNIRDTVFDPFFTTKAEGTGLGLGIAYNIVQLHQGSISFVSNAIGTTFVMRLPVQS